MNNEYQGYMDMIWSIYLRMEPFQWNNDIDDNFLELVHWINPGFQQK